MPSKKYKNAENPLLTVSEPAVAYQATASDISSADKWNPNVPFHGTQEEWWEHFHRIEEGKFETWEEHQKRFYAWKEKFLESLM